MLVKSDNKGEEELVFKHQSISQIHLQFPQELDIDSPLLATYFYFPLILTNPHCFVHWGPLLHSALWTCAVSHRNHWYQTNSVSKINLLHFIDTLIPRLLVFLFFFFNNIIILLKIHHRVKKRSIFPDYPENILIANWFPK